MRIPCITEPAAVAALVRREAEDERRAVLWECVPVPARMVALMCAKLPRERATEPLANFTRKERELIALNVGILTTQLNTAVFAMRDTAPTSVLLN